MIIVPLNEAFRKRAASNSENRVGSDAHVDPAKVQHGHTVWLLLPGSSERQEGHFDEPSNGCVLKADFETLKADRASANRKRKPYDWRTMRSPLRNSSAGTSFVREPALIVAAAAADVEPEADPAAEGPGEADHGPRPARSLIGGARTEAVRRRPTGAQPEDGIPAGALPA